LLRNKLNKAVQDEVLRNYFEKSRSVGRFAEYAGADGYRCWKDAHPYLARHMILTYGDPTSKIDVSSNGRRIVLTRDHKQTLIMELGSGPVGSVELQRIAKTFADAIFQDRWYSITNTE